MCKEAVPNDREIRKEGAQEIGEILGFERVVGEDVERDHWAKTPTRGVAPADPRNNI